MKKNGLFKILIITILAIVLLTWFIPGGYYSSEFIDNGINRLGFFDFWQYLILPFFQSMFVQVLIFILSVGALYGVVSKTGAYRTVLEKLAKKLKKKGNLFLILTAFVFAGLSSFGGYGLLMFIFIPAVISLILLMGYDKLTALLVTFGAMLVGVIGATYANPYLSTVISTLATTYNAQILFKVGVFVVSFAVLAFFMLKQAKKSLKVNAKKDEKEEDIFLGEDKTSRKKAWPLYVIFGLLFVLMVLGCTGWSSVFGITAFTDLHTSITTFAIKDYTIFKYILGSIAELGTWSYFEMSILCTLSALVIGKIYKNKFNETLEEMVEGLKKLVKPALLVTFAYGILIIMANTGIFTTLMSYVIEGTEKYNAFLTSIIIMVGSVLHVDLIYVGNFFLPYLAGSYTSVANIASLNILSQGIYGVTMFVAPTSLFLILGLTYLDIPYKKWLKFIWKLAVALLIVVVLALIAVALFVK